MSPWVSTLRRDRLVDEASDLAQAPAQLAARIVRDVPQQLAELASRDGARGQRQLGEQRAHLARRRQRQRGAVAADRQRPEQAQLERGGARRLGSADPIPRAFHAAYHARPHGGRYGPEIDGRRRDGRRIRRSLIGRCSAMDTAAAAISSKPRIRPARPPGHQGAPAGRLVVGRLRRRRHHLADRRRGAVRGARPALGPEGARRRGRQRQCRRSPPRGAGATSSPPTTCRRCSSAPASAPRPSGSSIEFREADAEALPFADASFDVVVSTFGVMFTPDQDRAAAELVRVCKPRRQDRPRQLDARGLHRPAVQDHRQARAAACRRQVAGAVGHARAASPSCSSRMRRRSSRRRATSCSATARPSIGWRSSRPTTGRC